MQTSNNNVEIDDYFLSEAVTLEHFGANYLAHLENATFEDGASDYLEVAESLGVSNFRYPGGTIAEEFFDVTDPRHFSSNNGEAIEFTSLFNPEESTGLVGLYDFLQNVQNEDGSATVVVPTIVFADAINSGDLDRIAEVEETIKSFIRNCVEMDNGNLIGAFEIGNEYPAWMGGHMGEVISSSTEYATIMVNFSVWIDEAYDELGIETHPEILVQTPFVRYGGRGVNSFVDNILDLEDATGGIESLVDAFQAIDGLTFHNYSSELFSGNHEAFDLDFEIAEQMVEAFNTHLVEHGYDSQDYGLHATEWNTRNGTVAALELSEFDLAVTTLDQFSQLVSLGADAMHIWPILHNTHNSLAGFDGDGSLSLNIAGQLFASMQETLVGTQVVSCDSYISIDEDIEPELLFHAFQSSDETIVYLSNITGDQIEVSFDLSELLPANVTYEVSYLSSEDGFNLTSLDGDILESTLASDTIVQITFEHVEPEDYGYSIVECYLDFPIGLARPKSSASGGDDADFLTGTSGSDTIAGGGGHDTIVGGDGDDVIYGNEGRDLLIGGLGDDIFHTGRGADEIVFEDNWGHDVISDFNIHEFADVLNFSSVEAIESYEDLLESHLEQTAVGVTVNDNLGNSVVLLGIDLGALSEDHFVF